MKPSLKKTLITVTAVSAVAGAGALYAQSEKPAGRGMMQGAPENMMQGGPGGMMNMMQMMSQMGRMMEDCNKMMQSTPAQPRRDDAPTERKE